MKITKDTLIGDILDFDASLAPIFLEMGMHCIGCPASRGETLEQAAFVHGKDVNELLCQLNKQAGA
jgi:hybrid cluster-associated redox disulfide protein